MGRPGRWPGKSQLVVVVAPMPTWWDRPVVMWVAMKPASGSGAVRSWSAKRTEPPMPVVVIWSLVITAMRERGCA